MKRLLAFLAILLPVISIAQVRGMITDASAGTPLAYANILVKDSSKGTSANGAGLYELELKPGKYTLVFQYVGYQSETVEIDYTGEELELNMALSLQAIALDEVVVTAGGEDPAYPVIRKAIEKRKYYRDQLEAYSCRSYVKGLIEFLDVPEEFMGTEMGDLGGILDSSRQGIIYLSESESEYHYKRPNNVKEVMTSSLVSGNDNGFSFNRGSEMDFSFYDNYIDFNRPILSPIGSGALSYYRYRLDGVFYDEKGRMINKIEVIPKSETEPLYFGYIYIIEDLWNIHSAELSLTGTALKQPIVDTMTIRQIQVPLQEPDVWRVFSQQLTFTADLFAFQFGGDFTAVFTDYNLEPQFDDDFFSREVLTVMDGANERDSMYWDSIRPIPLTEVEAKDYSVKDSLQQIWESPEYRDSIDKATNKLEFMNILTGYTYQNSFKGWRLEFPSPLSTNRFNTIQGISLGTGVRYERKLDEANRTRIGFGPMFRYGFADDRLRWEFGVDCSIRKLENTGFEIEIGQNVAEYNRDNPVPVFLNTSYALYAKINYIRLYENRFQRLVWEQSFLNGFNSELSVERSRRIPEYNNSDFSLYRRGDKEYDSNHPLIDTAFQSAPFSDHRAVTLAARITYQPGQRFIRYPDRKFSLGSNWPTFEIYYRTGLLLGDASTDYSLIRGGIQKNDLGIGLVGESNVSLRFGDFISSDSIPFMDYQHFNANRFHVMTTRHAHRFLAMPYYQYSTRNAFLEAHWEHHFNGFILDKIPLLKKLGFSTVLKTAALWTEEHPDYFEVGFGIDKVGFGAFRILRVDFIWSYRNRMYDDFHLLFGLSL